MRVNMIRSDVSNSMSSPADRCLQLFVYNICCLSLTSLRLSVNMSVSLSRNTGEKLRTKNGRLVVVANLMQLSLVTGSTFDDLLELYYAYNTSSNVRRAYE